MSPFEQFKSILFIFIQKHFSKAAKHKKSKWVSIPMKGKHKKKKTRLRSSEEGSLSEMPPPGPSSFAASSSVGKYVALQSGKPMQQVSILPGFIYSAFTEIK